MDQSGAFLREAGIGATVRSALLIDGENVAHIHAAAILRPRPESYAVRRVYGDIARIVGWSKVPDLRVIHASVGHNSADILLAVDAMVLAHSGIRDFAIVTADSGLVHLIRQLREDGCRVVVMAGPTTSFALRVAGHSFVELVDPPVAPQNSAELSIEPSLCPVAKPQPAVASGATKLPVTDFDLFVRQEVRRGGHEGLPISQLNKMVMQKLESSIRSRPEMNWRTYFKHHSRVTQFVYRPDGPNASVLLADFVS